MSLYKEILASEKRIRNHIRKTPLEYSAALSKLTGAKVYMKWESEQTTGSFKLRGAFSKLTAIPAKKRKNGVVAYSTGNHAVAIAHASSALGIPSRVYVPANIPKGKLGAVQYYPTTIANYKKETEETVITAHAREYAQQHNMAFASPYNDIKTVSGQGTIGVEIWQDLPSVHSVFVCVGGGGLISGIGCYLKKKKKSIKMVGCLPKNSPCMYECVKAGKMKIVPVKDTLSDGSAGNNELDTVTFDYCKKYIDSWDLVNEDQIKKALRLIVSHHHKIVEGAAAVPLASLIKNKRKYKGKKVVLVMCGANISNEKLVKVLK